MPLIISSLVILIASIYGFTAILLLFKQLHLLTLVFAVTLIGIVIDYCFHGFVALGKDNHNLAKNSASGFSKISKIRIPLLLGFFTTALGYSALILSPLELLAQVAVFMIFGLLGALLSVLILLPSFKKLTKVTIAPMALSASQKFKNILLNLTCFQKPIFRKAIFSEN